jgi:hypothetical protein
VLWTGFIWLRIETVGVFLSTFGVLKILGDFLVASHVAASQRQLSSIHSMFRGSVSSPSSGSQMKPSNKS